MFSSAMKNKFNTVKSHIFLYSFLYLLNFLILIPICNAKSDLTKVELIETLDDYIQEKIEDDDIVGLNVVLVSNDNILWSKSYGFSNLDEKISTNENTMYQVGAISGVFTAALITRLVGEKLINYDDNIYTYLPNLKINYRNKEVPKLTIRNLLTHHAGLPINEFKDSWAEKPVETKSLLNPSIEISASYMPNYIYSFSNVGYSLLGLIIEKVTQLSYSQAMQKYVFMPLLMGNSTVNFHDQKMKNLAVGYKDGEPQVAIFPRDIASVGLAMTVQDAVKLVKLYFNKPYGVWKHLNETLHVQNENVLLDLEKKVGFSWFLGGMNVKGGGPVVWRGGSTPYYRSRISMLPESKLAVLVFSNDSRSWNAISDISEKALHLLVEHKTGNKQPEEITEIINPQGVQESEFEEAYSSLMGLITIHKNGLNYKAKVIGWPISIEKDKVNSDWYNLKYDFLGFIPIDIGWISDVKIRPAIIEDHRVLLAYYKGRVVLFGSYIEDSVIHKGWNKLQGEYQITNSDLLMDIMKIETGKLVIKDNRLLFAYELPFWISLTLEIPIKSVSDNEAIVPGLGTGLNERILIKNVNGKQSLHYSGYVLEKIKPSDNFNFEF